MPPLPFSQDTHACTCTYTRQNTHSPAYTHLHAHTYMHTHTHLQTPTHTSTHAYTHLQYNTPAHTHLRKHERYCDLFNYTLYSGLLFRPTFDLERHLYVRTTL